MKNPFKQNDQVGTGMAMLAAGVLLVGSTLGAIGQEAPDKPLTEKQLVHEIFDTMLQIHGVKPGYRVVHAKGVVCQGTFTPSKDAATLSRAGHFKGVSVPVIARLSDGNPDPIIPDNSP